ncbi:MAG: hypothetical protein COA43_07030 [Robiginitomaculum sp.]|nr:MAG: hypothetical protein COA43_07030 [Robiginitomaculum sp.]
MNEKESANSLVSFSWTLQGLAFGVVLSIMALMNLEIGRFHVEFIFLPLLVLYFWPVKASHSWSLICIFMLGIFHDIASNGPIGLWALVYLIVFVTLGGGLGGKAGFRKSLFWFILIQAGVIVCVYVIGYVVFAQSVNILQLLMNGVIVLCVFPLVFWFHIILGFANEDDGASVRGHI